MSQSDPPPTGADVQQHDVAVLLTIPEAAARLRIGRSTAYELIAAGELEVVHIGRSARVPAEAVETFVHRLRSTTSPAAVTTVS